MNYIEVMGSLNPAQAKAASTLEGAIMVIAGAGTGKTQTLSARAATMLRSEQMISAQNVLCLTFTDAASYAMRKRLIDMVGTEAYKFNIYTFHAWCNEIIQDNLYLFGINDLEPASELEINNIIKKIIDEIPEGNPLYRVKGDKYYEVTRLKNLFSYMKRENVEYEIISYRVNEYLESLPTRDEYIYKKNGKDYKAGDIKLKLIAEEKSKMDALLAGANLLCRYDELMQQEKRYDFDDMLQWVIGQWQSNENFLRSYQERYQYIMVDEFQDTNGAQMKLLELLCSYWEDPNLFVVGDDDQCIYEFGGARLSNMKRLLEKYKAQMIFLNENYRSDQTILDIAEGVIQNNIQRLLPTKNLVSRIVSNPVTYLCEASNIINEEAFVYSQVSELIRAGVSPGEIGILYRKHKIGENVIRMLKNAGVPVNVKRSINILTEPIIIHLMGIIRYISGYTKSSADEIGARLFEILHYPFLNNDIRELHNLHLQGKLLEHPKIEVINKLTEDYYNLPLIKFIEKLTYELIMPWVVKHEDRIKLNLLLGTFFDFVKTETFKRPWMTGDDLIKNLDEMVNENIRINVMDVNTDEEGVTCSTIHGAKGLEWKHVFLMGCMRSEWESSRAGATSYKLPDTLTMGGEEDSLESNRRLFYVAVTRAKTNLIISYSRKDNFNKDLEPSQFVIETGLSPVQMDSIDISPVIEQTLAPEKKLPRADKQFIENSIPDTYTISISAVNKYLECPVQFYYENVLRAPFVASEPLVYGNSIHEANMKLYMKAREGGMSKDEFLNLFKEAMMKYAGQIKNEYLIKRIDLGIKELVNFYDNYYPQSNKITLVEHKVKVVLEGIPFLYIFDKMEFENIYVVAVDYKTGKKAGVIQSLKPGGHYWRQMVAPKLVLDAMHSKEWKFKGSRIDLFDEGFHSFPVEVSPEDEKLVMNDIKTAYDGITHHLFDVGCGVCKWCQMESGINHK